MYTHIPPLEHNEHFISYNTCHFMPETFWMMNVIESINKESVFASGFCTTRRSCQSMTQKSMFKDVYSPCGHLIPTEWVDLCIFVPIYLHAAHTPVHAFTPLHLLFTRSSHGCNLCVMFCGCVLVYLCCPSCRSALRGWVENPCRWAAVALTFSTTVSQSFHAAGGEIL